MFDANILMGSEIFVFKIAVHTSDIMSCKTLSKHRGRLHWPPAALLPSLTQLNCGQLQSIMVVYWSISMYS